MQVLSVHPFACSSIKNDVVTIEITNYVAKLFEITIYLKRMLLQMTPRAIPSSVCCRIQMYKFYLKKVNNWLKM